MAFSEDLRRSFGFRSEDSFHRREGDKGSVGETGALKGA